MILDVLEGRNWDLFRGQAVSKKEFGVTSAKRKLVRRLNIERHRSSNIWKKCTDLFLIDLKFTSEK